MAVIGLAQKRLPPENRNVVLGDVLQLRRVFETRCVCAEPANWKMRAVVAPSRHRTRREDEGQHRHHSNEDTVYHHRRKTGDALERASGSFWLFEQQQLFDVAPQ